MTSVTRVNEISHGKNKPSALVSHVAELASSISGTLLSADDC